MMDMMRQYARQYPVGTELLSWSLDKGIHRVTGYLLGEYSGGNHWPWRALACEVIVGENRQENQKRYDELVTRLVSGSMPPIEKFTLHVVESCHGPSFCKLDQVKLIEHYPNAIFTWAHDKWMVHDWFPGYGGSFYQPPEPEEHRIYGHLGIYDLDITWNDEIEQALSEGRERDVPNAWLVDVVWYMRNWLEDNAPYPVRGVLIDPKNKQALEATIRVPKDTGDIFRRTYLLEGISIVTAGLLAESEETRDNCWMRYRKGNNPQNVYEEYADLYVLEEEEDLYPGQMHKGEVKTEKARTYRRKK